MLARVVAWAIFLGVLACTLASRADDAGDKPSKPPPKPTVLDVEAAKVPADTDKTKAARKRLVDVHIVGRGVKDKAVLAAMRAVKRHQFVPAGVRALAYLDRPLPIGEEQTISQPYVVASMTEELGLKPGHRVLEIGTGSGYQAAVLAEITSHVYSIEIKEKLAKRAAATLKGAGYTALKVRHADGYYGWAEEGPFDAIVVTAAAPRVPPPLVKQLKPGGRMVIPVGRPFATQDLVLVHKDEEGRVRTKSLYRVRFVPLTGSLGKKKQD